jgi:enoyl-CoA hydratase/carnithine racemase
VADDARAEALRLAETIVTVPARAIRSIKETLRRAEGASIDVVLTEIEAGAQADLFNHPDFVSDAAAWITRHGKTAMPHRHGS